MSILDGTAACTLLHEGGEAAIYKVDAAGRSYVLKWYQAGAKFDASVMDRLRSMRVPGIYRIVEVGEKAGRDYLLYDYIEGISVAELGNLSPAVAVALVRRLVASLAELAKSGIHHGDLNPDNVVVDSEGMPTLIDCGIVGPGALAYAAPERIQGKPADARSDIYSLGLLLYRLVAGENLLKCDCFDDYAQAAAGIDDFDLTALLYGRGAAAEALSVLAPVWKASLRANPSERAEDLDEFDEILEIAFDSLSGGSVAWSNSFACFVESVAEKIGTKRNEQPAESPLPPEFAVTKPTGHRKKLVLAGAAVLILFVLVLFYALSPREPSIDETGAEILLKSRSVDGAVGITADSLEDSARVSGDVLEKLPVPELSNTEME